MYHNYIVKYLHENAVVLDELYISACMQIIIKVYHIRKLVAALLEYLVARKLVVSIITCISNSTY